jgi:ActR/RegA family two-component response regulator
MTEKAKILFLDDDKNWRRTIENIFKDLYDVETTNDPAEVLIRITVNRYALVILDEKLGRINGLEILKQIKTIEPEQGVIILTGYPNRDSENTSKESGAIAYLSKGDNYSEWLKVQMKKLAHLHDNPIKVFLSYEQADVEKVTSLYHRLRDNGYTPWRDENDLLPGQDRDTAVTHAINSAHFFLACLSSHSISKSGSFRKQFQHALDRQNELLPDDVYFIPVRLSDCEVPEPYNKFQPVNFFETNGFSKLEEVLLLKKR